MALISIGTRTKRWESCVPSTKTSKSNLISTKNEQVEVRCRGSVIKTNFWGPPPHILPLLLKVPKLPISVGEIPQKMNSCKLQILSNSIAPALTDTSPSVSAETKLQNPTRPFFSADARLPNLTKSVASTETRFPKAKIFPIN